MAAISKVWRHQPKCIYLKNNPAKFKAFLKMVAPNKNKKMNNMSGDMGSVPDPKKQRDT